MTANYTITDDNIRRADEAAAALRAFGARFYNVKPGDIVDDELASLLVDLLADLRHYAARNGIDYAEVDAMAAMHFDEESGEGRCDTNA